MDLEPTDLHGSLADFIMGYIGYHVFVGADTGGQNLGHIRVGQGRETPVDTSGRRTCPVGSDFTKGVDKRKDPVLVIQKNFFIITGFNPAKGHGRPIGKSQRKYGR